MEDQGNGHGTGAGSNLPPGAKPKSKARYGRIVKDEDGRLRFVQNPPDDDVSTSSVDAEKVLAAKELKAKLYRLTVLVILNLAAALVWGVADISGLRSFITDPLLSALFVAMLAAAGAIIWLSDTAGTKTLFIDADNAIQRRSASGRLLSGSSVEAALATVFDAGSHTKRKKASDSLASATPDPLEIADHFVDDLYIPDVSDKFESYMKNIESFLESQISLAERKASTLLDKGTAYIRNGILFYVATIIGWQIFERNSELTGVAVVGMVSCSLTFLVIEFLAAWFLRQYRSFVDASNQFLRIKSVFNRLMLAYVAIKAFSDGTDISTLEQSRTEILSMLAEDIKWPEPHIGKNGDFNHMMEMFDSLTKFFDKTQGMLRSDKPST